MADILTQLQTCLDQLATQFYATLCYLTTYHDNSPAIVPSNVPDAAPSLARIPKNSSAPPVPAQVPLTTGGPGEEAVAEGAGEQTPHPHPQKRTAGHDHENDPLSEAQTPAPDSPLTFSRRQRELARDLIIKEQQIEYLISVLPGIGSSEQEQEKRIRELERELRAVEEEREGKARELRRLRGRLEGVLGGVQVGVYGDRDRTHVL